MLSVGETCNVDFLELKIQVFGVHISAIFLVSIVIFFLQGFKSSNFNPLSCHTWLNRMSISKSLVISFRLEISWMCISTVTYTGSSSYSPFSFNLELDLGNCFLYVENNSWMTSLSFLAFSHLDWTLDTYNMQIRHKLKIISFEEEFLQNINMSQMK